MIFNTKDDVWCTLKEVSGTMFNRTEEEREAYRNWLERELEVVKADIIFKPLTPYLEKLREEGTHDLSLITKRLPDILKGASTKHALNTPYSWHPIPNRDGYYYNVSRISLIKHKEGESWIYEDETRLNLISPYPAIFGLERAVLRVIDRLYPITKNSFPYVPDLEKVTVVTDVWSEDSDNPKTRMEVIKLLYAKRGDKVEYLDEWLCWDVIDGGWREISKRKAATMFREFELKRGPIDV